MKTDWWDELSPEEQNEIEEGLAELYQRKFISQEKVMKFFDKYHQK